MNSLATTLPLRDAVKGILWLALAIFLLPLSAQMSVNSGSIRGRIVDLNNAAISGATVTATNDSTGASATGRSGSDGTFTISSLPFGQYTVKAEAPGYVSWLVDSAVTAGQEIQINPKLNVLPEAPIPLTMMVEPTVNAPDASGAQSDFVRVSINGVLGPMGYIATPSLSAATQLSGVNPQAILASTNYNFPSIILYISATPIVYAPSDLKDKAQLDKSKAAQETNRNPAWLDATFRLTPQDDDGKALEGACSDGSIQVLGLLPQQTIGGSKNQGLADAASAANNVAGALASFYPGVKSQVSAATQALNVLFQDIFPPQPVAYQYSFMDGNCTFGWFFRPNSQSTSATSGEASILGTQTGIILLKTDKKIKKISVSGQTLSLWNKPPSTESKSLLHLEKSINLPTFSLPEAKDIDYNLITDLKLFPALISKDAAKQIVHVKTDEDWTALVTSAKLVTTPDKLFVTNASLTAFLTASQSGSAPPASPPPNPGPGVTASAANHR